jgi:small subunit ribosomal protein S16
MATRIRLRRVGRKRQASFRIVVAGSVHAREGRVTETIGKYNPRTDPSYIEIDEKRALYWLRQGAEMSSSVSALFRKAGVLKKLADGAEGEEKVVIGDADGQTVLAGRPVVKVEAPAEKQEVKEKPAKPKAAKAKAEKVEAAEVKAEAEVSEPEAEAPESAPEAPAAELEVETEKQEEES